MTSPNQNFEFSQEQISIADGYKSSGDLPGMYRYLSQQVVAGGGDVRLSNWLSTAADINEGTGFYAGFVRGATHAAGEKNGIDITAATFQSASDTLAVNVFNTLSLNGALSLDGVIKNDVGVAVTTLGLTPDGWAGTLGAMFPMGLGGLGMSPETATYYQDLNSYYASQGITPLDRAGKFFDLVGNDFEGFVDGSRQWWKENIAGPEDVGTLADPAFWGWVANGLSEGIQNAAGAVNDPAYWDAFADRAAELWHDASTGIGNTWDFWFDPLWDQITGPYVDLFSGRPLDQVIMDLARQINGDNTYRIVRYDPLALDLDGDGLVGTRADMGWSGALFDQDGDGIRTATGWVGPMDGLLVRDLDGNGVIDSGKELFGDQTILPNGRRATNGYEALAALDSNGDGRIDATDVDFSNLRIWRDENGNGLTEAGELLTLTDLGIVSISTSPNNVAAANVTGGMLIGTGSYERRAADGTIVQGITQDFNFNSDSLHSEYAESVQVPTELASLANVRGMGKMRDLREACALSPALLQSVQLYVSATTRDQQRALLPEVLLEWAKTSPTFHVGSIELHGGGGVADPNSGNVISLRPGEVLSWPESVQLDAETTLKVRVVEALLAGC